MSGIVSLFGINMREGLRSLSRAKLRSVLGLIGLVIGVGSVITIISIGEIARETSRSEFDTLGTDILIIESANQSSSDAGRGITLDDALRVADSVPSIVEAAPRIRLHDTLIYAGKVLGEGAIHGVTGQFARVNSLALSQGRFVSHVDRRRYFCVVGAAFANAMRRAGASTVVGESIAMLGRLFTVVGVLEEATGNYSTGVRLDPDSSAFIPVSTARWILPRAQIDTITARARSDIHPSRAASDAQQWFRNRPGSPEVEVTSATQLIEQRESQMRIMTLLLAAIGSISLVVGGIGVMNIMLMSVNERKKGDRDSPRARRAPQGHSSPVPRRVGNPVHRRRHHRYRPGHGGHLGGLPVHGMGFLRVHGGGGHRSLRVVVDRNPVRVPAGEPGVPGQSDRGAQGGVAGLPAPASNRAVPVHPANTCCDGDAMMALLRRPRFLRSALVSFACLALALPAAGADGAATATGPGGGFVDVTEAVGLSYPLRRGGPKDGDETAGRLEDGGLALVDIDGDGRHELYVAHGASEPGRLFSWDGKRFAARAGNGGIAPSAPDRAGYFIDLDDDGAPDFLSIHEQGLQAFRNDGSGRFAEMRSPFAELDGSPDADVTGGQYYSMAAGDYDRDGDLDLFFAQWGKTSYGVHAPFHYFWRNDGKGRFADISRMVPVRSVRLPLAKTPAEMSLTPTFSDIDGDRDPDILLRAISGPARCCATKAAGASPTSGMLSSPTRTAWARPLGIMTATAIWTGS